MTCCTRIINGHTKNDRWVPQNVSNSCVYRESKQKPAGHTAALLLSLHFCFPFSIKYITPVSPIKLGSSQGRKMRGIHLRSQKIKLLHVTWTSLYSSYPNMHQWPNEMHPPNHVTGLPGEELSNVGRGSERTWCVTKMKTHFPLTGKITAV